MGIWSCEKPMPLDGKFPTWGSNGFFWNKLNQSISFRYSLMIPGYLSQQR
jgi:hypothetical protein